MKRDNKIIMHVLFIVSSIFLSCTDSPQIQMVKIKYVDADLETPIRVDSNNFENYFSDEMKTITIYNKIEIQKIVSAFNNLCEANAQIYSFPDTRMKMEFVYRDSIEYLYVDRFVVQKNDKIFILSDSLKSIINSTIRK